MEFTPLVDVLLHLPIILGLMLRGVVLGGHDLTLDFAPWLGGTFALFLVCRSKVSLLLLEFMLNIGSISVCCTKRGDVQELHFLLNVSVQETVVLEHHMFIRIFDTQLCV